MLKLKNIANLLWTVFGFGGAYTYFMEERYSISVFMFLLGFVYLILFFQKKESINKRID